MPEDEDGPNNEVRAEVGYRNAPHINMNNPTFGYIVFRKIHQFNSCIVKLVLKLIRYPTADIQYHGYIMFP